MLKENGTQLDIDSVSELNGKNCTIFQNKRKICDLVFVYLSLLIDYKYISAKSIL